MNITFRAKIIGFCLLLFSVISAGILNAQNSRSGSFWALQSYSGKIGIVSQIQNRETLFKNGKFESLSTQNYRGKMELDTRSYLWHPNFLQLDIGAGYSPGLEDNTFLVAPDRSETLSLKKIYGRLNFFTKKPFSFGLFSSYNHNYINRDLTTDVEMQRTLSGGSFSFRNYFLPVRFEYLKEKWDQFEIQTGREFNHRSEKIHAGIDKSFSDYDQGKLTYTYEDYIRQYSWNVPLRNMLTNLIFDENLYFDKKRENNLNANFRLHHQVGSQYLDRIQAFGNLRLKLPVNFNFNGNYRYFKSKNKIVSSDQHNYMLKLDHKLYRSLKSNIYIESNTTIHSNYEQYRMSYGAGLNYQKKIPSGELKLYFDYRRRDESWTVKDPVIRITDEEHDLDDSQIVLLNFPNIIISSVRVTDETKTIIFQQNIDYILIPREEFLEIQRLPGGQISSGETVYIDYLTTTNGASSYDNAHYSYGVSISILNRLFEFYVRRNINEFDNLQLSDFRILKAFEQTVVGGKISIWRFNGGYEYDNFNSNIVPYRSNRIFFQMSGLSWYRLNYSLSGNYRTIFLKAALQRQEFGDVSAKISYAFSRVMNARLNGGYRKQLGRGLDLDLLVLRGEFILAYRKIAITFGIEMFRRLYITEDVNYKTVFLRIERKF